MQCMMLDGEKQFTIKNNIMAIVKNWIYKVVGGGYWEDMTAR